MYLKEIATLLSWPAMIFLSYYLIKFALKRVETKLEEED